MNKQIDVKVIIDDTIYSTSNEEDRKYLKEVLNDIGYIKIKTNDWLTKGVSKEQLEREKQEALDEFAKENGYRKVSEGEWVDRYKGRFANPIYVCSVCGKGTLLTPHINELGQMEMVQAFSHFCPNCGAKMKYESEGADDD